MNLHPKKIQSPIIMLPPLNLTVLRNLVSLKHFEQISSLDVAEISKLDSLLQPENAHDPSVAFFTL